MFAAYVVSAALMALALTGSAALTFTRNEAIVASMSKLGVPDSWFPRLATLKAAGAVGLLVGLAVAWIGIAAAVGVVLYFVGAVITHVRARDFAIAVPVVLTLIAAVALVFRVASV